MCSCSNLKLSVRQRSIFKNFMNANEILNRIMMLHQTPILPSQISRQLHLLLMSHNTDDVLALIALKSEQSEEKSWYKNILFIFLYEIL